MSETENVALAKTSLLTAIAVYALWVLATYLLEGRVGLLQQPDVAGRVLYGLITNILIGTIVALWALRIPISAGLVDLHQLGLRSVWSTTAGVVVAFLAGLGFVLLQPAPSFTPIVLANVFAQVLPTSIAEIMVCWAVVGAVFAGALRSKIGALALVSGIILADLVFGIYHFAHSAPFNQMSMVLFLMIPGLVTSLIYFLGHNLYAAIVIQNFLGSFGVMRSLSEDATSFYSQPLYALYLLALVAALALIGGHVWLKKWAEARRQ